MIYGIGVDILRVERIERVWQRHGGRFSERILHEMEQTPYAAAKQPAVFLAKAFAAKEAFVKAMGTGFRGIAHHDVGLLRGELGRPQLTFSPALQTRLNAQGIRTAHVSLSDEGGMVCAMVVLEN